MTAPTTFLKPRMLIAALSVYLIAVCGICAAFPFVWRDHLDGINAADFGVPITLHNTLDEAVIVTVTGSSRDSLWDKDRYIQAGKRLQIHAAGPGEYFRFRQRQMPVTIRGETLESEEVFCFQSNWDALHEMYATGQVITFGYGDMQC